MAPPSAPRAPAPRFRRIWLPLAGVLLAIGLYQLYAAGPRPEEVPYSTFREYLAAGRIASVQVSETTLLATLKAPLPDGNSLIVTARVAPELAGELGKYGVTFSGAPESGLLKNLVSWVLPTLLFLGLWLFLMRGSAARQGGLLAIGKSKAKVYVETDTKVTFDDVAGVDEAKGELREVISFLKDPKAYGHLGARIPKGILLVGPPGTGKTLLARAVAGEARVPFFSINGSEFVEMFVGVGAARVRDLFEQARQTAPCIVFIDEIDALGRARGAPLVTGANDEKEQTLNQLLAELDGFNPESGVVFLAATNRPEILDPALLRAGRFDRQVLVDRPDKVGRARILTVHLKRITIAPELDIDQIAALTPGFTGADLANLVNEAALVATRRNGQAVTLPDVTAALERIVAGLEKKNRLINPRERTIVAHHEMGHALVSRALPGSDPVHKVSIIPRGIGALGYTLQRPTEDRYLVTRAELERKLTVLLGGRAAEMLIFGELSTGAGDDLAKATDIARDMVTRYGMDPGIGHVVYAPPAGQFLDRPRLPELELRHFSEATAREVEGAVRQLLERAFERATAILELNRAALETGARKLLDKETLTEEELPPVISEEKAATPARTTPRAGATLAAV
jgi:cell division protease FtsH